MDLGPLKDKSNIAVYYKNMEIDITEEVLLFDFSAIVAAVGGSMGLFLGFSCYSLALDFCTVLQRRIKCCNGMHGTKKNHQSSVISI